MTRNQALLAAAGLTVLVLMVLVWGERSIADAAGFTATPTVESAVGESISVPTIPPATTSPDVQRLTDDNRQLRETIATLLEREATYQRQIELANQQLRETAAQPAIAGNSTLITAGAVAPGVAVGSDDEAHEYAEQEYYEHENEQFESEEHEHEQHEREDDD